MRAQITLSEVLWSYEEIARNRCFQVRQDGFAERLDDTILQARTFLGPIDLTLKVGNRTEDIKAIAVGWRKARIRRGRAMKIERKIFRQYFTVENITQQFAISPAKPDCMMCYRRISLRRAKIQNKQTHRKMRSRQFQLRRSGLRGLFDHRAV